MNMDGRDVHPPFWMAGEDNLVTLSSTTNNISNTQSSSSTASPKPFTMDDYIKHRQAEAVRWINLQEKRASIIARLQPVTSEEYQAHRVAIMSGSGSLRRKGK